MAFLTRQQDIEIKSDFLLEFESGKNYTPLFDSETLGKAARSLPK